MTATTTIDPRTLATLRKARKFGRPRLAKLAGLTERFVTRLEGTAPLKGELTQDMLLRIADALQVRPEVLTGEVALSEMDLLQPVGSCRTGCCG